ncbi:MAG: formylglycine-generating enzyme family protein [Planctomycetota bacterium]
MLLGAWGSCGACAADIDGDTIVGPSDLAVILSRWSSACVSLEWATVLANDPDPAVVTDAALRQAIATTGLPWRVRDNASQIEMLLVPPGTFEMGCSASLLSPCASDGREGPVHTVTISRAYYLGRYEVTQSQWQAVVGSNYSFFQGWQYPNSANRPVEIVSWNEIQGFLSQTGLRLPTEAEWERAYRAGTTTAFHAIPGHPQGTNDDALVGNLAWFGGNAGPYGSPTFGTKVVGQKAANGLGLHDMAGNVDEFVSDWFAPSYGGAGPVIDPTGPATGTARVLRGGSWSSSSGGLRASGRGSYAPTMSTYYFGFRAARNP